MEKIKWTDKVTNKEIVRKIGEERTLLSTILESTENWIRLILKNGDFYMTSSKERTRKMQGTESRSSGLWRKYGSRIMERKMVKKIFLLSTILKNKGIGSVLFCQRVPST